jgi:hypothetical protein
MAATTTPIAVRALLIHDPRLAAADMVATSSAGPRADQPRRADTSVATGILAAAGDSDGTERTVTIVRGGGADPDNAARWGWSQGTEATRGAWGRRIVTGWELAKLASGSYERPVAVVARSGRAILAYYNGTKITTLFRDLDAPATDAYGCPTWDVGGDVVTATVKPGGMWIEATGRVCLLVQSNATYGTTTYTTFDLYYSDNEGTTWTLGKTDVGVRIDQASYTISRARAVRHGEYVTLVCLDTGHTTAGSWTSYDGGTSFVAVDAMSAIAVAGGLDLVACDDGSLCLFYMNGGGLEVSRKRLPTLGFEDDPGAHTVLDSGVGSTWSPTTVDSLVACVDYDGTILVLGRLQGDRRYRMIRLRQDVTSTDDILSDLYAGDTQVVEPAYFGSGASGILKLYTLLPWGGALRAVSLDTGGSPFLGSLVLGGWSSVDWEFNPSFGYLYPLTPTVAGWTWIGSLDPAGCGWTASGAGTGGSSAVGGWQISTSANTKTYERAGSASGRPLVVMARLRVQSGGSISAGNVAIRLIRDTGSGSNKYDVSWYFSGTGIRARDNVAAANIGSDASGLTSGNYVDVICALQGAGAVNTWWKAPTSTTWTAGPEGTATATATSGGNIVRWGSHVNSTAVSQWAYLLSAADDRQDNAALDSTSSFPRNGRELSTRPAWLQANVSLWARSVPVLAGDEWTVGTVYDHGNLDPVTAVSPGQDWRSTDDNATVDITWTLDADANGYLGSTSLGVVLREPNFRTATLSGYDGSTYTTLVSIDIATGMSSLSFTRSGYVLAPTSSPVGGRYAQQDEYAGGYAILESGGSTYVVPIEGNQGGAWRASSTGPKLLLSITRGTILTGLPTSGTIHLIPPAFVALAHGITTAYRAFRLRITAQDTAEGYFRLGRPPLFGPLLVFGRQYEQGRLIGPILTQEVTDLRAGGRRVRSLRRPRRYVELAWTQAIVGGGTGGVWGASPDPSGVAIYNNVPVALSRDPAMIEGILQVARGGKQPLAYLPSVATGSATSQFSGRERVLVGQIVGEGGARTAVTGRNEDNDEGSTLGTVRVEEIP